MDEKSKALLKFVFRIIFIVGFLFFAGKIYLTNFDYSAVCSKLDLSAEHLKETDLFYYVFCTHDFKADYIVEHGTLIDRSKPFDETEMNREFVMLHQFFWIIKFCSISVLVYLAYSLLRLIVVIPKKYEKIENYIFDFLQTLAFFMPAAFLVVLSIIAFGGF